MTSWLESVSQWFESVQWSSWLGDLHQFHFLRPHWLWLLPLVILAIFWFLRLRPQQQQIIDAINPVLLQFLSRGKKTPQHKRTPSWMLYSASMLTVLALAGPTTSQIPQPTYEVKIGQVLVMDMSLSLRATDIKPNRLVQARFKAIDFINANADANIGLVAYAGDAFTISPITKDGNNITTLLPSLSPELMPVRGSEPIFALEEARNLLIQGGYQRGGIVWMTDGVDYNQLSELQSFIRGLPYKVSIIAVGTETGAPIMLRSGEFLKDNSGAIVVPKVNYDDLRQLARVGQGVFTVLQSDNADIDAINDAVERLPDDVSTILDTQQDKWYELGPYLLIPVIFMILWSCRPYYLFVLFLGVYLTPQPYARAQSTMSPEQVAQVMVPPPSEAQTITAIDPLAALPNAFKNGEQQALEAYQNKDYAKAQALFNDPRWRGNALYQQGDYAAALSAFQADNSATGLYNQGNALAALQQYEAALAAYEQALELDPALALAQSSKQALETFLEQMPPTPDNQQQQEQEQQNQEQQNQEQQEQQQSDSQSQPNEQDQQSQDSQSDSSQNDSQSGGQQSEQNPSDSQASQDDSEQGAEQSPDEPNQSNNNEQDTGEQSPDNSDQQGQEAQSQRPSLSELQAQADRGELSPEELEQLQRMQSLMNKVPDDPAFLLQRKMQLEYQKRQRLRLPTQTNKDW